jgi:phosphatidate cytidylyltransferase
VKELTKRTLSGTLFVILLITCIQHKYACIGLFYIFGLVCLTEFNRLIKQKSSVSYLIFTLIFLLFSFGGFLFNKSEIINQLSQIFHVLSIFVNLFLIRDLFSSRELPNLLSNQFINTTFYITSGFIFLILIAFNFGDYNPQIILGIFLLIWTNDSFAYLIGKNFGKQKLFVSISPKKTIEGFLGGVFFSAIISYFITLLAPSLSFSNWLIISVLVSVFGTLGDLVESKYKRQASVKDSGKIMPGHGGMLDRLDSAIFAAPFIYLFLRILNYVS